MTRKLTISVADDVYEGLYRKVGPRRIGKFLEDLARPHVVEDELEAGYRAMAMDEERERGAREWIEALVGETLPDDDIPHTPDHQAR